jgi:glycosyltransferase involved in cell wall biosynthesis
MTYIIVDDYDYVEGGAAKVAIETANLLFENGNKVIYFCGVSDPLRSTLNKGIRCISCNQKDCLSQHNIKGVFQGICNKQSKKKMKLLLDQIDDEIIIHVHGWTKCLSSSFLKVAHRGKNVKLVLTLHDFFSICPNGGLFNYQKNSICHIRPMSFKCITCNCDSRSFAFKAFRVIREFYQDHIVHFRKCFDQVISISNTQKTVLQPYFPRQDFNMVFNPTSIKGKTARTLAEENKSFLYMGRITKDKGVDLLCDYFSQTNYSLIIIGTGYLEEELKNKYGKCENIHFNGWKNQEETYKYLQHARAVFIPSVYYEGAPLTVFEGLAFGVPVVVSSLCAGKDFVDNASGLVFNPYSFDEFQKCLIKLSDNQFVSKLSSSAYDKYWNLPFDSKNYYSGLLKVYGKCFNERNE